MVSFEKKDLLKIAQLSALSLDEKELEKFADQLKQVLEYTSQIAKVHSTDLEKRTTSYNVNVFREDIAIPTDSKPILDQAPEKQPPYFKVPKIL